MTRSRLSMLVLFLASFTLLSSLAGTRILSPSGNLHHAYAAQAWLDGRMHLGGTPPGYCDAKLRRQGICTSPRHDDWARVTTLQRSDGSTLKAYTCRTSECKRARRKGTRSWIALDGELHEFKAKDIRSTQDTWYVSFPPGPAAFFLPFVALFGVNLLDTLLTVLLGALTPLVLVRALDRVRGDPAPGHYWGAAAWLVASPFLFVASHGNVWFTAQVLACLCICAYLGSASEAEEPLRAGIFLALAMACRPHLAFGCLWFFYEWRRTDASRADLIRFATPLVVVGLMLAAYNYARFGNPFEFGHRFLDIRWQTRMQEQGQFSLDYLLRNLRCAFWLWPQVQADAPFFKTSLHGSALWLGAPWLVMAFLPSIGGPKLLRGRSGALCLCALVLALPALLYHNSGQRQFSYRFALDWLPFVLLALSMQGMLLRRSFRVLVLAGAVYESIGAWHFESGQGVDILGTTITRDPRSIFVTSPLGWPFQDE